MQRRGEGLNLSLPSVIGLTLDEAWEVLASSSQTAHLSLRVVETAPPQRPARPADAPATAQGAGQKAKKVRQEPPPKRWGEWRVLRALTHDEAGGTIELLVAREELRPVEAPQDDAGLEGDSVLDSRADND